ncbi:tetratricopeptide repeat protein [Amycolatopsis sp. CA-128772]|uniref:ATP-binding protein n=1 Tax=Amycolatopsis sp. CA-128772 TaxID=2073159 RepID=UPI0011B06D16|nr:tetratricopeptide repeat protein [Amycolatopsis sp. CA-128772]
MTGHKNVIRGIVFGPVVQAGSISGGVHLNLPAPAPVALAGLPPDEGFIGRAEHAATLREVLGPRSATSVCAIAGLAGVGKTALTVHAAKLAMADGWFPGGVLFVDLQGYDTARVVDAHIALGSFLRALGVPGEHIPSEPAERALLYRSVLATRAATDGPMLVIADNAADLDQVLPLRPGEPGHRMLVTSRHTLPIPAARRLELDAPPMPEALAMLAGALTASHPADTRITTESGDAVALAELCGKLPLALGILAHLLADQPARPLAEVVDLLRDAHDRIGELAYGDSIAVRAAFDASYQRLSPEQARAFRFLALNPGPHVGTGAASALLDRSSDRARRLLEELRRAHLLQPAIGDGTYRFHDLLRLYAEDHCRAEDTEAADALERLLAHYADVAADADSHLVVLAQKEGRAPRFTSRQDALTWFDAERPNLVAAIDRAGATGHHAHAVTTTRHMYWFFQLRKHWADWLTTHEVALAAARATGDDVMAATMLNRLGNIHQKLARPEESIPFYEEALSLFEAAADARGQAQALINLGVVFTKLGRPAAALDHHDRALKRYRQLGDRIGESLALASAGAVYRELGRLDDALRHYLRSADLCRELGYRDGEAKSFSNLGNLYTDAGRLDEGLAAYRKAVDIYRDLGDEAGTGLVLTNLGTTYAQHGDIEQARSCYAEAQAAYEAVASEESLEWVRSLIARLPPPSKKARRLFKRR